jgi:hypothetical protein
MFLQKYKKYSTKVFYLIFFKISFLIKIFLHIKISLQKFKKLSQTFPKEIHLTPFKKIRNCYSIPEVLMSHNGRNKVHEKRNYFHTFYVNTHASSQALIVNK